MPTKEELMAAVASGQISEAEAAQMAAGQQPEVPAPAPASTQENAPAVNNTNTKLTPRTAADQGFSGDRAVIDLAELRGWGNARNRRRLLERGFTYQDATTGNLVTVDANSLTRKDMRLMARKAAKEEETARLFGLGDMSGWSEDAKILRRQQVGDDRRYTNLYKAEPAAQEAAAAPERNYDFSFGDFFEGDNSYYKPVTKGILEALYENGNYDALDSMVGPDGKIGLGGWQRFHDKLAVPDANSGYFDEASIRALAAKKFITDAQAQRLINGLPVVKPKPAATTETTAQSQTAGITAQDQADKLRENAGVTKNKKGGRIMKYFQQGGSVAAQQVAQEQAQQQEAQLTEMFMALAKNPKETLLALQKQGVQPKQVIELAQKMADKNPAAKEALVALSQMSQMAKQGAKLTYIRRLRGECPEGYEARTYKIGGKVCKKCEKIEAECGGGKAKKHENGGEAKLVTEFKELRCGGKTKKK